MSRTRALAACAAVVAALLFSGARIDGQGSAVTGHGHGRGLAATERLLPDALAGVEAMLVDGRLDLAAIQEDTVIRGRSLERLGQFHGGVPVFGGQVVRQMDGRAFVSVSGRLFDGVNVDVTPAVPAYAAAARVLDAAGPTGQVHGEPALGVLPHHDGYRLAYRVHLRTEWSIQDVFVDASTGELLQILNGIHSQVAIGEGHGVFGAQRKVSSSETTSTYQAVDRLRPAPTFTLDFRGSVSRLNLFLQTGALFNSDIATASGNVWTDGPTVDAHVYHGWVYDYFYRRFDRRGMDDRNLEVDGIVHPVSRAAAGQLSPRDVGTFVNNAFYCCNGLLVYGDGDGRVFDFLAGALDVVAHEWTHGVTDYTSRLIYRDESGALNEAFSDIMAAAVEFHYQPTGSGRDRADWHIAEDVYLPAPGYLRSLSDPISAGEPDHYSLRQHIGTPVDDGGVHVNATIATHAFYLAVAGGRNRVSGITVPGVGHAGFERIERAFYRAFTMLLAPSATFLDARHATLQAAADLYGTGSRERAQIELAWTAVGVQ